MIKNSGGWGIKAAVAALALVIALPAFAQTTGAAKPQNLKQQLQQGVRGLRQTVGLGTDLREDIKLKSTEIEKDLKDKREEVIKIFEKAREEAKTAAETKRTELKKKIKQLKDEKKKEIALRVDEQLDRINEQWTTHFLNVLNHLSDILGKVELRAEKAKANGRDITSAANAIAAAKQAIEKAKAAVEAQAKKSYVAQFTSEAKLKDAFKAQRDKLHQDLFGLRDGLMTDARKAVQAALQSLKGIPGVDEEPAATSTPSTGTSQ